MIGTERDARAANGLLAVDFEHSHVCCSYGVIIAPHSSNSSVQRVLLSFASELLAARFVCNNTKSKIYGPIILPGVFCGCASWAVTFGEERNPKMFENMVLRKTVVSKREDVTRGWRKLHVLELHDIYTPHQIDPISRLITPRRRD